MEILPDVLLNHFQQFPHSTPIIETFRKISDPNTYQGEVQDETGKSIGDSSFKILAKPNEEFDNPISVVLNGNPIGPYLEILIYEQTKWNSQYLKTRLKSGWDYAGVDENGLRYDYKYMADITGSFDPTLNTNRWMLNAIGKFSEAGDKYFSGLRERPSPRWSSDDIEDYWQKSEIDFLASLR